jgi:hypothetical protein
MPHQFVCALTLLVCVSFGCSSENAAKSAAGGASRPDPCTLVTADEAEAILGVAVKPSKLQGMSSAAGCQYIAPSAESVTIQVHYGLGADYDNYVKTAEESFSSKAQPVPGVGEKAVFNAEQLIVKHHDDFFILTIGTHIDDQQRLPLAINLAQQVVTRLGS